MIDYLFLTVCSEMIPIVLYHITIGN